MKFVSAAKEVIIDLLCCAVLFVAYEAVFDHFKLVNKVTGVDVAALLDAIRRSAMASVIQSKPRATEPQKSGMNLVASSQSSDAPKPEATVDPLHASSVETKIAALPSTAPTSVGSPLKVAGPHGIYKRTQKPQPIKFEKRKVKGVPYYIATIDLNDPDFYAEIALPHDADQANTQQVTHGDENFEDILKRHPAAFAINGTFFAKSDQKSVMGNMVSGGRMLKYSQWEDYGTTLGLRCHNEPEMLTAGWDGKPDWFAHWFSLTCGPRLLENGDIKVNPEAEGFSDDHVLGIGPRSAIGFPSTKDKLYVVSFLRGLSLEEEAKLMQAIGCSDAMNLDGGASKAVAYNGKVIIKPGRNLTNVLLFYDCKHRAPKELVASWNDFQQRHDARDVVTTAHR